MKISFLVSFFPPYIDGVSTRAFRIAKGLAERGHELTIYTASHPNAAYVEKINGMKVKRYDLLNPFPSRLLMSPGFIMPRLLKSLGDREIRETDIIQSIVYTFFVSLISASLKLVHKKVFALCPMFPPRILPPLRLSPRAVYRKTLGAAILQYADCLIAETDFERNRLRQGGISSDKIHVIPNAIDSGYNQLPDRIVFRKKYKIDADEKIVLFVGSPTLWKGIHHLMIAMSNVLGKVGKAKLVLVGPRLQRTDTLLRDFASPVVKDRIVVTGPLVGESLLSAFSAADLFVLPSRNETFGMVILEAAASGLPIVCTKTGVAPEVVVAGKNGLFIEYGRIDEISDAIIEVCMTDNYKIEAERRRDRVLRTYDYRRVAEQYEEIYSRLLR